MNFLRALPALVLALPMWAQTPGLEEIVQGGGEVTLDGLVHRFEPSTVTTLPDLVRLTGRLVPPEPDRAFDFELALKKDGTLQRLQILRQAPGGYPDTWAATEKTRIRFRVLEDRSGGRVEIICAGPLTGVVGRQPKHALWKGLLWVVLP